MALDSQSLANQNEMKASVIILNWNGAKWLRQFLPAVIANTNPRIGRVIVADNGSTDDSLKLLADEFAQVEVFKFDKNHGFAGGYNRAIAMVDTPYTVLLNSDVEPAPGWLDALCDYMESHPETGACQPKVLSWHDRTRFEYAGAAGGFIDRHGYPYCRGRIMDVCEEDNGQYDTDSEVFWASGAALMVDTALYKRLGGLDEQFFAHQEEIDLCWRIQLAGRKVVAVSSSTVYHVGGGSLPAGNPRKVYLNFRNSLLMLHKNLPDSSRRRTLFIRRLLDTLAWAKSVVTLKWSDAGAILRAHNDYRRMARQYTTHPDRDLLHTDPKRPDLLIEYFFKRHKRFAQIK